jgi:hypothetical protein
MVSFSFRGQDVIWPIGLVVVAIVGVALNQSQGTLISSVGVLGGLGIAFANLLVDGYYRSRANVRELEHRARLEAQPLLELKAELLRELTLGRDEVNSLRAETADLQAQRAAAAQLASLDKDSVLSLLIAMSRPDRASIWIERLFGFASGVVASLVATMIYELAKR